MEYRIIQKYKELYSAEFDIVDSSNRVVGNILLTGSMGSQRGSFDIRFYDGIYRMNPVDQKVAMNKTQDYINYSMFRKPYCSFLIQGNCTEGIILNYTKEKLPYHFCLFDDMDYKLYVLGFGEKGICAPVYRNDEYVAEIHKECMIYNDLHNFHLSIFNENAVIPSILFACYMYVFTYYKAGVKTTKGTVKRLYTTKDREMISKCKNPYYSDIKDME